LLSPLKKRGRDLGKRSGSQRGKREKSDSNNIIRIESKVVEK